MSEPSARPLKIRTLARSKWWVGSVVGIVSFVCFGYDLASEPSFVDESAYLSQAYFADLWLSGDVNHPAWLDRPAYDLPPLPKYLFGVALRLVGQRRPGPAAAEAWYRDTSRTFVAPTARVAARWPSVFLGAMGCVAIYGLGVLAAGRRVGVLAALLLMINPLYRMHARRAMSDVPCEALILTSLVIALWTWRELLAGRLGMSRLLSAAMAGGFGGLAALSKLTGGLAMMSLAAWGTLLAVSLPGGGWGVASPSSSRALISGVPSRSPLPGDEPLPDGEAARSP
jgi:4-amino-4-deoxy-L-arabinose transferase-like glycosyltransferase